MFPLPVEHDLSIVLSLGIRHIRRDIRTLQNLPSESRKPLKGCLLNIGFDEGGHIGSGLRNFSTCDLPLVFPFDGYYKSYLAFETSTSSSSPTEVSNVTLSTLEYYVPGILIIITINIDC